MTKKEGNNDNFIDRNYYSY